MIMTANKIFYLASKALKKLRGSAIKNSVIHPTSIVESGCNVVNTQMDRYSFCGYDCEIINSEIGSFCSIANGVVIGGSMHPMEWVSTSPVFYDEKDSIKTKFHPSAKDAHKKTIIGHDVWIGQNVLIKQGIRIGNGAVIGMGSVVTKDVPPYSVVAGNPAKMIKMRFSDEIINKLQTVKWWCFSEDEIKNYSKYFSDPVKFLENLEV